MLKIYIIVALSAILAVLYSIKHNLDDAKRSAFILGCTDSGKVSRDVCVEEYNKQKK